MRRKKSKELEECVICLKIIQEQCDTYHNAYIDMIRGRYFRLTSINYYLLLYKIRKMITDLFISCAHLYKFIKHRFFGVFLWLFLQGHFQYLAAPSSVKNAGLLTSTFGIGRICSSPNGCLNRVSQSSSPSIYDSNIFLKKYFIDQYTHINIK